MNQVFKTIMALIVLTSSAQAQSNADAIIGEWLSAKKDSRVQIFKQGAKYYGNILWGTGGAETDVKNPDTKLRNRRLVGLTILKDFVFDRDDTWEEGTIYDPREGKTYSCKMTLKNATQLSIRGYVGISLFGRSELWTRVK